MLSNQQELIEHAPFGIYIVDSQLHICHMNARSQTGAFRNVRPVIGRDFAEAMRILWPEPVAEEIIRVLRHTMDTGEPYYSNDFVNPRADVEKTEGYEWELHRIVLSNGQHGVVCYYFDSTKLRVTEKRQRLALDAGRMGTWDWDLRTGLSVWNAEHFHMLAYEPGTVEPSYEAWVNRVHPDDRAAVEAHLGDCAKKGTEYRSAYRALWPDGSVRWLEAFGRFERGPDQQPVRCYGVVRDVTDRKHDELQLIERARLLDLTEDAILTREMDGRIRYWNQGAIKLYGWTREEAVGGVSHALLRTQFPKPLGEIEGDLIRTGFWTGELIHQRKDGLYITVLTRWVLDRDAGGRIRSVLETNTDVSERKRAEQQRQRSDELFQVASKDHYLKREFYDELRSNPTIIEFLESSSLDGLWYWDIDHPEHEWMSPRFWRVLGYEPQTKQHRSMEWKNLIDPEDLAVAVKNFTKHCADPRHPYDQVVRYRHQDGSTVWIRCRGMAIRDATGKPRRFLGAHTDVTAIMEAAEQRAAEAVLRQEAAELEQRVKERTQELERSEQQLRALAAELNLTEQRERKQLAAELHDHLQQLLVFGRLQLGQGKRLTQAGAACVDVMERVDDALSDALTYTRTLVAELSPSVLRDHGLAAGLKWLAEYMNKRDLTVTVHVPPTIEWELPEDQSVLLFQSVRELLINSAKHAGTGRVTVMMEQRDGVLWIQVRDEGAGFDVTAAEAPSRDWCPKFGLLSIRERMRSLGGSIKIQSAPGQGTTATLVLPLDINNNDKRRPAYDWSPVPQISQTNGSPNTRHSDRSGIRVLLVDDHVMVRQGLRSVLDAYQDLQVVGEAQDGVEAMMLTEKLRPRVIVMDINMPKMNGIEATEQIKHRYPETLIIGLSVNAGDQNQEAMMRAGAVRLLTKEAAVEQLYAAIQQALKQTATGDIMAP